MQLVVTTEARLHRNRAGALCYADATRGYGFWSQYLAVFDAVTVVARVSEESRSDAGDPVEGPAVTVFPLPSFRGALQYITRLAVLHGVAHRATAIPGAFILRSGVVASLLWPALRATGRPYGIEVVGDPWDVFAPGVIRHPLRPLLRHWLARRLRLQCLHASAASYVTERMLQERYPCPAFALAVSDVVLPEGAFAPSPRRFDISRRRFRLITVGSLAQPYKGTDALIDALTACVSRGLDLELVVVGDGRYRATLHERASRSGVGDRVRFAGRLTSPDAVRRELDLADVFVLPSRVEGLPRALLEAMARALPCVASSVGGISELLPAYALVPPGDVAALVSRLCSFCADPTALELSSAQNLECSRRFHADALGARRVEFLREITRRCVGPGPHELAKQS